LFTCVLGSPIARYGTLDHVRVKVIVRCWIGFIFKICVVKADQIECLLVSSSGYADVLCELEDGLELVQVGSLDAIEAQTDRYKHKQGCLGVDKLTLDLVQEDVSVQTHMHLKVVHRPDAIAKVPQHHRDHLRAKPLTWPYVQTLLRFPCDILNTKWADINIIHGRVVHEHLQYGIVLLLRFRLFEHFQGELLFEYVPFECFHQDHLARAQHAAPAGVRPDACLRQWPFNLLSVGEPRDAFKLRSKLPVQFLDLRL